MRTPKSIFEKLELVAPDMSKAHQYGDNPLEYRAKHDTFVTMLKAALSDKTNFDLLDIIYEWWETAYGLSSFPEEGITLGEAAVMIQYKLMGDGVRENGITLSNRFDHNYNIILEGGIPKDKAKEVFDFKRTIGDRKITINKPDKEFIMAKVEKVQKEKKVNLKEKASDIAQYMLLQRKLSDEDIADAVNKKVGEEVYSASDVAKVRKWINANAAKWPELKSCVKTPLEEIGGVEEKPKSGAVSRARKAIEEIVEKSSASKSRAKKEEINPEGEPETHESARSARKPRRS